jgi:hypothetical protein
MLVPNKHRQQKASEGKHYILATIKSLIRTEERERDKQAEEKEKKIEKKKCKRHREGHPTTTVEHLSLLSICLSRWDSLLYN